VHKPMRTRPTIQLLGFLAVLTLLSLPVAAAITPWIPYDYFKVLRRVATIGAALLLIPFVTRVQGKRFSDYGLARTQQFRGELLWGIGLGVVLFASLAVLQWSCGTLDWKMPTTQGWATIVTFVPAALIIALLEETFFRGVVMQSLAHDMPVLLAAILSSLFYAILHFVKYLADPLGIIPEVFGLCILGLVLAYGFYRTKLLAIPIGLHMAFAYLARVDKQFIEFHGRDPQWIFGTHHWVTGLFGWGMLALAAAVIWWHTRTSTQRI
jgi:uncharacterized protein